MPDFYADYPFPEVVLKIADPEKFCAVGDIVIGMKTDAPQARVERFVDGGIRVHPINPGNFHSGDTLVSPTGVATISEIERA